MADFYLIDLERSIRTGEIFYWKADRYGYTAKLRSAGVFDEPVAKKLCDEDIMNHTIMVSRNTVKNIIKK